MSSDIHAAIDRAVASARKAHAIQERAAKGGAPDRHPMPTKQQALEAFAAQLADDKQPLDDAARARFERWWVGEQP